MTRVRRGQRAASAPAPAPRPDRRAAVLAVALFLLALVLRLLYWRATPDRAWAYAAAYKGDARLWLEWARALEAGTPFQLGLPLQPPGSAYLVSLLWDGSAPGVLWLRALWCALGALVVALAFLAVRRGFGARTALVVGLLLAGASASLQIAASIDAETPYLVLVLASFLLHGPGGSAPRSAPALALWSALQALACLFRVEHALFALALWGWWLVAGRRAGELRASLARRSVLAGVVALLVLAPWHATSWRRVARFNESPPPATRAEESLYAAIESRTAGVTWTPEAERAVAELPAFARRQARLFVAATVAHRGGARVAAADLEILREAFGAVPRPLPERFFVSLYGPLNFALAHHDAADGGFSTARLEAPPPLAGGSAAYPPELVAGLPPPQLALVYPPHLELVVEGGRIGREWIWRHPGAAVRLAGRKLLGFWRGAALGLTGYGVPIGANGVRGAVDLVVPPPGGAATLWRLGVLALCGWGIWRTRPRAPLAPWLLFAISKAVVAALFFGYARLGATAAPVVALLAALAFVAPGPTPAGRRFWWGAGLAAVLLLGVELARWQRPPAVLLDGRPIGAADPFPADLHRAQRYEAR